MRCRSGGRKKEIKLEEQGVCLRVRVHLRVRMEVRASFCVCACAAFLPVFSERERGNVWLCQCKKEKFKRSSSRKYYKIKTITIRK